MVAGGMRICNDPVTDGMDGACLPLPLSDGNTKGSRDMYYKIMSGKHGGSGSFLCPPGHPALTHSIYGWGSKSWATRGGPDAASAVMGIEGALEAASEARDGWKDTDLAVLAPAVRRLLA